MIFFNFVCCLFVFVCFYKALWNVFKVDFFFLTWVQLPMIFKVDCFNHNVWQKHVLGSWGGGSSMRPEAKFSRLCAFGILSWTWIIHLSPRIMQGSMRFSKPVSKVYFRKLHRKGFHFIILIYNQFPCIGSNMTQTEEQLATLLHSVRLKYKKNVFKCINVWG